MQNTVGGINTQQLQPLRNESAQCEHITEIWSSQVTHLDQPESADAACEVYDNNIYIYIYKRILPVVMLQFRWFCRLGEGYSASKFGDASARLERSSSGFAETRAHALMGRWRAVRLDAHTHTHWICTGQPSPKIWDDSVMTMTCRLAQRHSGVKTVEHHEPKLPRSTYMTVYTGLTP